MQVITNNNGKSGIFLRKQGKNGIMVSVQHEVVDQDFMTGKLSRVLITRNEYWKYQDITPFDSKDIDRLYCK